MRNISSASQVPVEAHFRNFGFGVIMGIIHAATGPDHMSAVVTLSVNQQRRTAAWLGIRWGMGHSIGLIVVTGCVLLLRLFGNYDQDQIVDLLESGMDWLVGVLMLLLGCWGYWTAWRMRQAVPVQPVATDDVPLRPMERFGALHEHDHTLRSPAEGPVCRQQRASKCHKPACASRTRTPSLLALGTGIAHGMGGPGGVLAVLPTLLIPGALGSTLYLGGFCLSATLTMSAFASLYGACTYRSHLVSSRLPWVLQCVSASMSVAVGILWLVCSATGTLDEVLAAFGLE